MQYVEMIAHACRTVHAPGVEWPEWIAPEDRPVIYVKRKPGIMKKSILAFLDGGGTHTSDEINNVVGGPIMSTRTCLLILANAGEIEVTVSKNWQGRPINIYTRSNK
jgi:hypothetical protein